MVAKVVWGVHGARLDISLVEGVTPGDMTESEAAIYQNIAYMADERTKDAITITSKKESPEGEYQPDNYSKSSFYSDNFEIFPEGTEEMGKLAVLDHFLSEQWAGKKNGADPGNGKYPSSHKKALEEGAKRFGYTWEIDEKNSIEGEVDVADLFDKDGNYMQSVKLDYTQEDKSQVYSTFVKDKNPKDESE